MTEEHTDNGFIPCDGCGQYFREDELRRCTDCGKVFCPECRKTHTCDESDEITCSHCGRRFPKDKMKRCADCGEILCPNCRKKHDCTGEKSEPKDRSIIPVIVTILVCAALVICVCICVTTGTSPIAWFAGEPIAATSWVDAETSTIFEFYKDKTGTMITTTNTYQFSWNPTGERSYTGGGYSFYLSRNQDSLSITDINGVTRNYMKMA